MHPTADPGLIFGIDAVLPQTQCRQCGYAGCRPYAVALAAGLADINQCPPGGDEGVRDLAVLLGIPAKPIDPRFGVTKRQAVALIDESLCIGCTLCIKVCPVDAIAGVAKRMHTVIARDCTGCELCLAPCPVDCIRMTPTGIEPSPTQRRAAARHARVRVKRRDTLLERARLAALARPRNADAAARPTDAEIKRQTVQRALERARHRIAQRKSSEQ